MPYTIRKVRNQDAYTVFNKHTGHIYAYTASRGAALAQLTILEAVGEPENFPIKPEVMNRSVRTRKEPAQYAMRKVRGQDCYKVYSRLTKRVFAKCTTQEKAARQLKLLMAIRYSSTFERLKPMGENHRLADSGESRPQ